MIELTFNESAGGALKFAKSMKSGDILKGAVAVFGGTRKEKREAQKPHIWKGDDLAGNSGEVACLNLMLDMGSLSDMDGDMAGRTTILNDLFGHYPGVPEDMWKTTEQALLRLKEAKTTSEPVRLWACMENPAELCGVYFTCRLMQEAPLPLSLVRIPKEEEEEKQITRYRSMGEVDAEKLGKYARKEQPISVLQKGVYAHDWIALVRENAPLRAVVNGTLMSVNADFYDGFIRSHLPKEPCSIGRLIGKTLSGLPGVGDFWLYARIRKMIEDKEMSIVLASKDGHPYSAMVVSKE